MVGGEEEFDACASMDTTTGPVALRSGPGGHYSVVGHLDRGASVFACDMSKDLQWEGIVIYPANEEECGVGTPIPTRQAYRGACRSGWIRSDSVVVVAG
jgi:hypothetical protein